MNVKGKLEVVANKSTRMGSSPASVPEGTIGYVLGIEGLKHKDGPTGFQLVYWPNLKTTSSHYKNDLTSTGRRG